MRNETSALGVKKNIAVKIMAFLALFWIIASIIWTWILVIMWDNYEEEQVLNIKDLEEITGSWDLITK
jgi:preprotein translocase subunit SecG